ncbi:MAG: hypothetical protein ACRESC_02010 [Gammaproteobacteria bacterium]
MKMLRLPVFVVAMLLFAVTVQAAAPGSIKLQTIAQQEKVTVDKDGVKHTEIVPAGRVLPGVEVIYTIKYTNVGNKPAEDVLVNDPIPEHMTYVDGSANGDGTAISYSVDGGKHWSAMLENLEIDNGNSTTRSATARDVTDIRWVVKGKVAAGASGQVSFRAVLQ